MTPALFSDQKPLHERSKEKHILNISSVSWTCSLLLLLLLIIGFGILTHRNYEITTEMSRLEINNNQSVKINNQLDHEPKQVKQRKTYLTTTVCPRIACSISPSLKNPSLNYQVEQLYLNCSQSLSNLTITHIVQRTFHETHAQQYQSFWDDSTNMTFIETPTQIIYIWYSLPGMHIDKDGYPYFTNAQYYYMSGAARITQKDKWQVSLQSICGDLLNLVGTF